LSTVQKFAKNTTVLLVAQVVSYLLAFFYIMYTARYLGPASFGILSFATAFTGIFAVFGDLGLQTFTVREVARDKSLAPKYVANISLMKIILVTITFGLIALTINLMGYPEETIKVVYLLGLSVIFTAFTQIFYSIFQAYEGMEYLAIGQMLSAALILGGVIFAVKHGFSVVGFAYLYVINSIIALGYSFATMKLKFSNPSSTSATKAIEFDWSFWRLTIKEALPFGLTMLIVTIFSWIDTIMLSFMKGDAVVGWYNAAYRMVQVSLFIPAAWYSAILPVMSKLYITSRDSLRLSFEKSFKYLTILGIPMGVGATLLAQRFILLIFGSEYVSSIITLQILIWSSVLIYMSISFGILFQSLNKQIIQTKILGICMLLNIVLNLLFIPKYSYIAASATAVATQLISLALHFMWSSKIGYSVQGKKVASTLTRVLAASALMGAFIMYFSNLSLLILVPLAALLYFVALYVIRGIDQTDIGFAKHLIRRTGRPED
jgi:O-antigen/teichoic acid export membrane protein